MASAPLHDAVKPLSFLLGTWKSVIAFGHYPTIKDFEFVEEITFSHVGQPNIQFSMCSCHPETGKPMHREVGFLHFAGDNRVAYNSAHNNGCAEVEEGTINNKEIKLKSKVVSRLPFKKLGATREIHRIIRVKGDEMEQIVSMATDNTPMTEHLYVRYSKV